MRVKIIRHLFVPECQAGKDIPKKIVDPVSKSRKNFQEEIIIVSRELKTISQYVS